jgi:hypothetical protein
VKAIRKDQTFMNFKMVIKKRSKRENQLQAAKMMCETKISGSRNS